MSVVVLDFGSQYTRLIARRLRELAAFSLVMPGTSSLEGILGANPEAIILSGGPRSVFESSSPRPDRRLFDLDVPILGICYGMHLLVQQAGGAVRPVPHRSYGRSVLSTQTGFLFDGIPERSEVWMSHGDAVTELAASWRVIASSTENPIVAIASPDNRRVGVQFHPEVVHTPHGQRLLANFLDHAGVARTWSPEHALDRAIADVREATAGSRTLLAVSGGVDSSALALLLVRAGIDHAAVFVDHGLLRHGERVEVERSLTGLGVSLHVVDARDRFFLALSGITDPEAKRKAIGREFIDVFREKARTMGTFRFLAQGTLYPDVIESAGSTSASAANIKSHHNVGGLPEELGFELLEPFRLLFKDEVREIAGLLGLPDSIRLRHPFPGPGLAIRVLGEASPEMVAILRRADDVFIRCLREWALYDDVWQALATLTPLRSVGVAGDDRRYGLVLGLRAVTSVDGMTADWAKLPHDFLDDVAQKITRQVPEIGRVVYDITSKPPATIEWE
ncbi:glutamine-hydrolyzing GMP synthase [Candidatus Bipolaricaulota bacterium]|nr:glutamine-hydrolyzing GMP synthase [Candidatus Bipolaricaulota bacterium]